VDEYHEIILSAFNKPSASVTRMADKQIDVSDLHKTLHLVKRMYNTSGEKIEMRDRVRWIKMWQFGSYWYRYSLSEEEEWEEVSLLPSGQSPLAIAIPELLPSVKANVAIKLAKWSDIRKQLRFIPAIYHGLYNSLTAEGNVTTDEESDEDSHETLQLVPLTPNSAQHHVTELFFQLIFSSNSSNSSSQ